VVEGEEEALTEKGGVVRRGLRDEERLGKREDEGRERRGSDLIG
jgi:hypothetical protein